MQVYTNQLKQIKFLITLKTELFNGPFNGAFNEFHLNKLTKLYILTIADKQIS